MLNTDCTELTYAAAWDLVGGLSRPSKMPGWAYGLPAKECKTGSTLRGVAGSTCSKCYALKGRYTFGHVQQAQYRRLDALKNPRWVEAMILLLSHLDTRWFRWHDSGDIQAPSHLEKIVAVAQAHPQINFWLPTRERVFVHSHLRKHGAFPENLVVRLSATMIDGPPPPGFPHTSTVVTSNATCRSLDNGGVCGACRQCWDKSVPNVSYMKH